MASSVSVDHERECVGPQGKCEPVASTSKGATIEVAPLASASMSVSQQEEDLCGICFESPFVGVELTCGHKFCRADIVKWHDKYGRKLCPVCRVRFVRDQWRYLDDGLGPGLWPFEQILFGEGYGRGRVYTILWCDGSVTREPKRNVPPECLRLFNESETGNRLRSLRPRL